MGDKFFITEETVKLEREGSWFEIKQEMSIGDHERLERELWQFETAIAGQQNRAIRRKAAVAVSPTDNVEQLLKASYRPSHVILLEINLVAWSFDKPLNRENISKLRPEIADWLIEEIDKLNPQRQKEEMSQ